MSVINHNHEYIFLHQPHTAGRAIEAALMQHEGSENFNGLHHIPVEQMLSEKWLTERQLEVYHKFRVIRNPYDVLVTYWITNHHADTPFYEWASTVGPKQTLKRGTMFWRYQADSEGIIRYEDLQSGLNRHLERYGAPPVQLQHIGKTPGKPDWRDLLTVSQAKHLEKLYPDIKRYGYQLFRE